MTVREAAQAFVDKVEAIHADPTYKSVWMINQVHTGPYTGPTYTEELGKLKDALAVSETGRDQRESAAVPILTAPSGGPQSDSHPMPNPSPMDLVDPLFNAIWNVTKTWDVNAPEYYKGYCGLNGSHVMLIVNAIRAIAPSAIERREPTLEILTAMAVELGMMPAGDPLIVQWIPTLKRQYLAALKVSERASPQVSVPARIGDSLEQRAPDSRQAISTPTSDAPLTPPPEVRREDGERYRHLTKDSATAKELIRQADHGMTPHMQLMWPAFHATWQELLAKLIDAEIQRDMNNGDK